MFLARSAARTAHAVVFVAAAAAAVGAAQAAPLTIKMQGIWDVQYEYLGAGANFVPVSVPKAFETTIVFDVDDAGAWFVEAPHTYLTQFGAPTMSSDTDAYGPGNPFATSSPNAHTLLSRHDYSVAPDAPAPFQQYQFASRDYASSTDQAGIHYWNYGLEFYSANQDIALDDLRLASAAEFVSMLEEARDTAAPFYTSFTNYTYETQPDWGPPLTYTGGIGLSGEAKIVSVSYGVPEPSSALLLLAGLAPLTGFGRSRRKAA